MVVNNWLPNITDGQLLHLSNTFNLQPITRQEFVKFFDTIVALSPIDIPLRDHNKDVTHSGEIGAARHALARTHPIAIADASSYSRVLGHALADWIRSGLPNMSATVLRKLPVALRVSTV